MISLIAFNVKFTAEMETKLDEVEYHKIAWNEVVQEYYDQLIALIRQVDVRKEKNNFVQDTGIVCDVVKREQCLSDTAKEGDFLSCSRYPLCKTLKNLPMMKTATSRFLCLHHYRRIVLNVEHR